MQPLFAVSVLLTRLRWKLKIRREAIGESRRRLSYDSAPAAERNANASPMSFRRITRRCTYRDAVESPRKAIRLRSDTGMPMQGPLNPMVRVYVGTTERSDRCGSEADKCKKIRSLPELSRDLICFRPTNQASLFIALSKRSGVAVLSWQAESNASCVCRSRAEVSRYRRHLSWHEWSKRKHLRSDDIPFDGLRGEVTGSDGQSTCVFRTRRPPEELRELKDPYKPGVSGPRSTETAY